MMEPISLPTERTRLFDPADELARLRERRPLCRLRYDSGELGWLVTSHVLARGVLRDPRFGMSDPQSPRPTLWNAERMVQLRRELETYPGWRPMRGFIEMNPPEHSRYRRLLAASFTAARMAHFRPRIEEIVADRIAVIEESGPPVDLVSMFAAPISLTSQCALLGIPSNEAQRFFRLGTDLFGNSAKPIAEAVAEWRAAWEFARALAAQKQKQPTDDVISDIARQGELSDDELADTTLVLFQGGLETTGDMLVLATFVLLCEPDQLEALRTDPTMIESAVEELLRFGGIFRLIARTALEDVELEGTLIKAGETVTISLAAANRDPGKFDRPDELTLRRSAQGHLAFAHGVHVCIGQHLARVELQIGLTRLIQHFPTLHLAVPTSDVPVYGPFGSTFGVHELPIAW
jgi:cytochrome P450